MPSSRRGFVVGMLAAPTALLAVRALGAAGRLRLTGLARPGAEGRSSERCARCGAGDHTMLDRRCPAAPEVV